MSSGSSVLFCLALANFVGQIFKNVSFGYWTLNESGQPLPTYHSVRMGASVLLTPQGSLHDISSVFAFLLLRSCTSFADGDVVTQDDQFSTSLCQSCLAAAEETDCSCCPQYQTQFRFFFPSSFSLFGVNVHSRSTVGHLRQ